MSDLSSFLSSQNKQGWSDRLWDGLIDAIQARLAPLEEQLGIQREVSDAIIARGLTVIEQELAPIVAQADEILNDSTASITEKLTRFEQKVTGGTVISYSNTSASLSNGGTINLTVAAEDREFFAVTPYVALSRASTTNNWSVAKVNSFDRLTGALSLHLEQVTGPGGPFNDWVITALPAATMLQRAYVDQTLTAKAAAEGAATASANSAGESQAARIGSENARDESIAAKNASQGILTENEGVLAVARTMIAEPIVEPTDPHIGQLWWDGNVVRVFDGVGFVPTVTASIGGLRFDEGVFGADPDGEITIAGGFRFVMLWLNGVLLYESRGDFVSEDPTITIPGATEGDEWKYWAYQAIDATDYDTKEQVNEKIDSALTDKAVRVDADQDHTAAEKGQARANIGVDVLSGFRNKIINGDFSVTQRGFTQTSSGYGSDDRWANQNIGSTKLHQIGTLSGSDETIFRRFSLTQVTSVVGDNNYVAKTQRIEDVHTLAGKRATLTFYAAADVVGKFISVELRQWFGTGGSSSAPVVGIGAQKLSLGDKLIDGKFSVVVDIPSTKGKTLGTNGDDCLDVVFWFDAGSNFDGRTDGLGHQSGNFYLAHISLVEGDATAEDDPFSPRHIQQEIALCQRYYQTIWTQYATYVGSGFDAQMRIPLPVIMRAEPTSVLLQPGRSGGVTAVINMYASHSDIIIALSPSASGNVAVYDRLFGLDAEL
ncbi:hypothetical protein FG152_09775 [Ochrobactrum sp. XJ1]|nr:hypothetical protein [Ochrobactrum sp. XJ1]